MYYCRLAVCTAGNCYFSTQRRQEEILMQAVTIENVFEESLVAGKVHPAVLQLGLQYANGSIAGGNARCLAMLVAFKAVIQVTISLSPCRAPTVSPDQDSHTCNPEMCRVPLTPCA